MPRNRFESYVHGQYTPQFTQTPFDTNFALQSLNAHQTYYDNLMKALDTSNPRLDYLKPNGYDMGDVDVATNLMNERQQKINSLASEMATSTNLTEMARKVHGLTNDQDYQKKAEALKYRVQQDQQYRTELEKNYGKDPYYNQYLNHYAQNRYSDPLGENYSLNSPLAAQTPDFDKKLQTIGNLMEADQFTTADGSIINRDADGQYYKTYKGKREQITYKDALGQAASWLSGDPEVQNWMGVMGKIGVNAEELLNLKLQGFAGAKSYVKDEREAGYLTDHMFLESYKRKLDNPDAEFTDSFILPTAFTDQKSLKLNNEGRLIMDEIPGAFESRFGTENKENPSTLSNDATIDFLRQNPISQQLIIQHGYNINDADSRKKLINKYNQVVEANKSDEEFYTTIPVDKQKKVNFANYGNEKAYMDMKTGKIMSAEELGTFDVADFDWENAYKVGESKSGQNGRITGDILRDEKGNVIMATNQNIQSAIHYQGWNILQAGTKDPNLNVTKISLPTADGKETPATVFYYYDNNNKKRALTIMDSDKKEVMESAQNTSSTKEYYEALRNNPKVYDEQEVENAFNFTFDNKYKQ